VLRRERIWQAGCCGPPYSQRSPTRTVLLCDTVRCNTVRRSSSAKTSNFSMPRHQHRPDHSAPRNRSRPPSGGPPLPRHLLPLHSLSLPPLPAQPANHRATWPAAGQPHALAFKRRRPRNDRTTLSQLRAHAHVDGVCMRARTLNPPTPPSAVRRCPPASAPHSDIEAPSPACALLLPPILPFSAIRAATEVCGSADCGPFSERSAHQHGFFIELASTEPIA
jgi:hypothetical protein